ncbi:Crp/Fnr family transcriptional regulator [Seonamhaeicola marinus]|uniref:Crp/Fnr family transcriptional regulator n=1 Tax=Seonamhaeicola marinus TaxID=1912246 RepID=A0A5D0HW71_9FLAO|nr:Crp/Fnr family transcriptional regulator [Seonamhaeicola marinus]TYA74377.1 Crp/Fnr family transcriptional regulator [Seonamhaeicola marinus]
MLRAYLQSFQLLTDDEITSFENLLTYKQLKKDDYFIEAGQVCKEVAFITSGFFRSYYYSSKEEEVTYCFTFSNSFITAYSSFLTQESTSENIQALTDIEMYAISRDDMLHLEASSSNWLKLFKLMAEREYVKMEKRIFMLQLENAETRYTDLLKNHPEYLQLIPLGYLSSYLGITQRHLSRIRKSITN